MRKVSFSQSKKPPSSAGSTLQDREVAEYIKDMAEELAQLCRSPALKSTADCLDLAAGEAGKLIFQKSI